MNKPRTSQFLAAGIFFALFSGCAMFQRLTPPPVVGNWTNPAGTIWMIKDDGTFDVDLNKDGKRDAWGHYSVDKDEITVVATGGLKPKGCDGKGVYRFKRTGNQLRFTLVSDTCRLRKKNILLGWTRKK